MKPSVSILSSQFKYTPSDLTDIRRTFAKARAGLSSTAGATLGVAPLPVIPFTRKQERR